MKRRPRWMRNHVACPDCGHIYPDSSDVAKVTQFDKHRNGIAINCPRCGAHYTVEDFWEEQYDKWDRSMKE